MSLYDQFQTDQSVEKEGVWLEFGKSSTGAPIRILIARAGGSNIRFQQAIERKTKPYRRQIQMETLDPQVAEGLFQEVYAETIVLGWENVEDREKKPIPFTKENCLRLFKELPDLFVDIRELSNKVALFRSEVREAASGN